MNLRGHWRYLKYVLCHKFFVYVEGRKLGLPHWHLIKHDLSKFSRAEWGPYVAKFYGPNPTKRDGTGAYDPSASADDFKAAWAHHWGHNPHHWEYWCHDIGWYGEDVVPTEPWPMGDLYQREMLADWRGAGRAQGKGDDVRAFYGANGPKMKLHPQTRAWIESELGL
jgi:hypothetical protein